MQPGLQIETQALQPVHLLVSRSPFIVEQVGFESFERITRLRSEFFAHVRPVNGKVDGVCLRWLGHKPRFKLRCLQQILNALVSLISGKDREMLFKNAAEHAGVEGIGDDVVSCSDITEKVLRTDVAAVDGALDGNRVGVENDKLGIGELKTRNLDVPRNAFGIVVG